MKITKKLISWKLNTDNSLTLTCDQSYTKVYMVTNDIIRIRTSFKNDFPEESYILTLTAWNDRFDELLKSERKKIIALSFTVDENNDFLQFKSNSLNIKINKNPYYVEIYNLQNQIIYSDLKSKPYVEDQIGRVSHYQELDLENDYFYGFGEKTGKLNKLRKRLVQNAKDTLGYDPEFSDPLYKHIPFYIKFNASTKHAIGLFYNNTYESVFDMGVEHSNYHHRYSYFCADGGDLDLFILNGPEISNVVKHYTDITGKSAMLPIYALGYLGSTMYYVELPENCDKEIINFVKTCRSESIPIDNFHLSSGYTVDENNKRQLFTWNNQKFSNPKLFFKTMSEIGSPATPNIKPGVLISNPNYENMSSQSIFILDDKDAGRPYVDYWWGVIGSFFDFTNPNAREIWTQYLNETLFNFGVTSLWNDNCEYDSLTNKNAICNFDGKTTNLAELKSVQPNLMALTGYHAMLKYNPNVRPYSVNRGGFAGIQRYSQTWAGDNYTSWKSLKFNIATILGMGLSGVANNGCDIGGFWGPHPEEELFVRWVQNGILQPRFSIHSCNTDNTVTEPWMFSDSTNLIREAIQLRYRLMPYLYSLMQSANEFGYPIMRPLVYEFQQDENTYSESIDFMFGSSLLIANIVEKGSRLRSIYLPKNNNWFDYNNYTQYFGGQTIEITVDLSSIPIFIRDNAIIPLTNDESRLKTGTFSHLKLIIGGENNKFCLYQDDGITEEFRNGNYLKTTITVGKKNEQTLISFENNGEFTPVTETLEVELINKIKGPYFVTIDGKKIHHYLHRGSFESSNIGWYYSNSKGTVEIKAKFPLKEIIVSFAHFDLIGM